MLDKAILYIFLHQVCKSFCLPLVYLQTGEFSEKGPVLADNIIMQCI